jgi:hypothetical protein
VTQADPTKTVDPHPRGARYAALAGGILLLLLVAFWVTSFYRFRLVGDERVSFPAWWFMGLDLGHNYLGVKSWLSGIDPYRNDIGDPRGRYSYPPIVLPIFAWCRLFSFKVASIIWTTCIAAMIAWAPLRFFVKLSSLILAGWALVRRLREPSVDAAGAGSIPLELAGAQPGRWSLGSGRRA